ncbi:PstS family phosphate ABC transporter substrate-binding protein [Bacillus sp. FJAT-27245]|uniref:PstS family phosphate ABC transporter substrate-binding protein n=1 Tax=Bacillus sp. FJAT-27245 TaxID=1684144 RepID=UPI0006A7BB04|nr:substrate-binding domain-containing protein [Bacillus sp. FJAT-27245]
MRRIVFLVSIFYVLFPFVLSMIVGFLVVSVGEAGSFIGIAGFLAGGIGAGIYFSKNDRNDLSGLKKFLPVFLPLFLTVFTAAILMLATKGHFGNDLWAGFIFLFFPFLPNSFLNVLGGEIMLVFLAPFAYFLGFQGAYVASAKRNRPKWKSFWAGCLSVAICLAISATVLWQRSQTVLPSYGFKYENGYSSVDLTPYYVTNNANVLPKLDEPATFKIEKKEEMPVLDGAEAAYPVYAAFANAVYENIASINDGNEKYGEIVSFTNTIYAFERLLFGEVDIFFGAQPSEEQKRLAESQGKELVMTPIGKEAFVFFANSKNPIDSLTVNQIKGIYSGGITNWSEVGGGNAKIRAFQRPEGSGSQTIMQMIMKGTPLMDPLKEEIRGMGDIIEEVADYRNYKNALGYSFRFFTTGMNPTKEIKLLAINGIEPSPETIQVGSYPYVVNLFAITLKDNPKQTIEPFLKWMQGPQGQKLVEEVGYIPLKN